MEHPKPGIYCHYKNKNNHYRVHGVAVHTETLEDLVVYEPLYHNDLLAERNGRFFSRPLAMFMDEVEKDGVRQPRFVYIGENPPEQRR